MARRCKMAKEFNWPKRVVLQRFHDDFYRHFADVALDSFKVSFYTELARPTSICCNATFIPTIFIRRVSKMKCLPHVWAEPDYTCTLFMDGGQN